MTASLVRPNEVDLGVGAVNYNFTSTMEIAEAMFAHQQANLNFVSSSDLVSKYRDESVKKFAELYGSDPTNFSGRGDARALAQSYEKMDKIIEQNRQQGIEGWNDVATTYEIKDKAIAEAREKKIAYDEAYIRAAPDAHPMLGSFAGGAAAWFTDPVQAGVTVLTAPISLPSRAVGMGRAAWVARAATLEAGLNAGMEVPFQIAVKDWQNTVGHEYGWDDAALNVAFAGAAGFVGSAIINTATRGWRRAEMTRIGDATTNVAHDENMKVIADAFDEGMYTGKMPELKLDQKATARKYESAGATQEEVAIVREFRGLDAGEKNLDGFAKRKFIEAKKEEYLIDSQLSRGDINKLQESFLAARDSIEPLTKKISALKDELSAIEARGNNITKQFGEAAPETKLVVEEAKSVAAKIKKQEAALVSAMSKSNSLQNKMRSTLMANAADRHLAELNDYKIPAHLAKKYTQFKKNVKEALEIQKKWEAEVRDYADTLLTRPVLSDADDMAKVVDTPEYQKSVDRSFEASVADSLTEQRGKFDYIDSEGNAKEMTLSEIADEVKAEKTYLQRVLSCAWGGK